MALSSKTKKSIPNLITGIRFLLIPALIVVLADPSPERRQIGAIVFLIAAISDFFDGYLARKWKVSSDLGALLDPVADKVLALTALVLLCRAPVGASIAAWMTIALMTREFFVSGIRSYAAARGQVVAASFLAKYKTVFTFLALLLLIWDRSFTIFGFTIQLGAWGDFLLWISLGLSLYTGWQYFNNIFRVSSK